MRDVNDLGYCTYVAPAYSALALVYTGLPFDDDWNQTLHAVWHVFIQ